jgi:hypothetical protein
VTVTFFSSYSLCVIFFAICTQIYNYDFFFSRKNINANDNSIDSKSKFIINIDKGLKKNSHRINNNNTTNSLLMMTFKKNVIVKENY